VLESTPPSAPNLSLEEEQMIVERLVRPRTQLIVSGESNVECKLWNVVFCGRMGLWIFAIPAEGGESDTGMHANCRSSPQS